MNSNRLGAVLIACALVAATGIWAFVTRHETTPSTNGFLVKTDRWTGQAWYVNGAEAIPIKPHTDDGLHLIEMVTPKSKAITMAKFGSNFEGFVSNQDAVRSIFSRLYDKNVTEIHGWSAKSIDKSSSYAVTFSWSRKAEHGQVVRFIEFFVNLDEQIVELREKGIPWEDERQAAQRRHIEASLAKDEAQTLQDIEAGRHSPLDAGTVVPDVDSNFDVSRDETVGEPIHNQDT